LVHETFQEQGMVQDSQHISSVRILTLAPASGGWAILDNGRQIGLYRTQVVATRRARQIGEMSQARNEACVLCIQTKEGAVRRMRTFAAKAGVRLRVLADS
jgi:hypothetical protein